MMMIAVADTNREFSACVTQLLGDITQFFEMECLFFKFIDDSWTQISRQFKEVVG